MKFECRTDALEDERFSFGRFELVDARRDGLAEFFFFGGIRGEFSPLDNMIYERGRYRFHSLELLAEGSPVLSGSGADFRTI